MPLPAPKDDATNKKDDFEAKRANKPMSESCKNNNMEYLFFMFRTLAP